MKTPPPVNQKSKKSNNHPAKMEKFMLEDTIFDTQLAVKIGIVGAIILRKLMSWEKYHKNNRDRYEEHHLKDGKWWVYQTYKAWGKELPFITPRAIQTNIMKLKDAELIYIGDLSTDRFRRTNFYALNWDKIRTHVKEDSSYTEEEGSSTCQEEESSTCQEEESSISPYTHNQTHNHSNNPGNSDSAPKELSVAIAQEENLFSIKKLPINPAKNVKVTQEDYDLADEWLEHEYIVRPLRQGKKGVHRDKFALDIAKARKKFANLPIAIIAEILRFFKSDTKDGDFWSSICQSPASLLDVMPSSKKVGEDKRKIEALIEILTPKAFIEQRKFESFSLEEKERIANPFRMR